MSADGSAISVLQRQQHLLHLNGLSRFKIVHAAQALLSLQWHHFLEQVIVAVAVVSRRPRCALELDGLAAAIKRHLYAVFCPHLFFELGQRLRAPVVRVVGRFG